MLDQKLIIELSNLKNESNLTIGIYSITVKMLNLGQIVKYSKELKSTNKSVESILENLSALIGECVTIKDNTSAERFIQDIPYPVAMAIAEEWVNLNFQMRERMIELLDRVLTTMVGKPVSMASVFATLSSLLSVQDIALEPKSGT